MENAMNHVTLIVAMARNRVIGNQGQLPWHLPGDLKHFKATTMGHAVIFGRKTYESLPGTTLPGRTLYVLGKQKLNQVIPDSVNWFEDADLLMSTAKAKHERVFVAGGAGVYKRFLPECQTLIVTLVDGNWEGDTFMPPFEGEFECASTQPFPAGFTICTYQRKTPIHVV